MGLRNAEVTQKPKTFSVYERAVILDPGMLRATVWVHSCFHSASDKKTTFQSKGLKLLDKIKILLIFCLYSIAFPHVYFILLYFISFNVYVKPFELPCDKMCCTNKLVFLSLALPCQAPPLCQSVGCFMQFCLCFRSNNQLSQSCFHCVSFIVCHRLHLS